MDKFFKFQNVFQMSKSLYQRDYFQLMKFGRLQNLLDLVNSEGI